MFEFDVYKDIATRTNGDIYLGVVGPVRSGKSTFISRFMTELVIPNIEGNSKSVAETELPQPASGKTIMTTEPKFVPSEGCKVNFDGAVCSVKLIDCVGYMVDGAIGTEENGLARKVKTPWFDEPLDFSVASEIGTKKVIEDHSTCSVVITTDGSFTDINRKNYEVAEEKVILELKKLKKPFIILFNCQNPTSKTAKETCLGLEEKYGVSVVCANVLTMEKQNFTEVIKSLLMQFSIRSFNVEIPSWIQSLDSDNRLIAQLIEKTMQSSTNLTTMKSFCEVEKALGEIEGFLPAVNVEMDMAKGVATVTLMPEESLFYKVLSNECGESFNSQLDLINYVKSLSATKSTCEKISCALEECDRSGYGIVQPCFENTELSEPQIVRKSGGYAVTLKAKAKSVHVISSDVETEINAVYGSQAQCQDFVDFFNSQSPEKCWDTPVFGKKLSQIVSDEIVNNSTVNQNVKIKLKRAITRAVNEKKNNIFCILF